MTNRYAWNAPATVIRTVRGAPMLLARPVKGTRPGTSANVLWASPFAASMAAQAARVPRLANLGMAGNDTIQRNKAQGGRGTKTGRR